MGRSITYKIGSGYSKFADTANTPGELLAREGLQASQYVPTIRSESGAARTASMDETLADNDTVIFAVNKVGA